MFGIAFLLVASIASAGVLNYYGKIEGTASVQGPIFYADLTTNGETVGKLLLNTKPSDNYTTTFKDRSSVLFWTDNLGGIDFNYIPKCNFSVKVSSNTNSKVELICEYYDTAGNTYEICNVSVDTTPTSETKTASCSGNSQLSSVNYIIYEIKGTETPETTYTIETNAEGDTRFQLDKVNPEISIPGPVVSK